MTPTFNKRRLRLAVANLYSAAWVAGMHYMENVMTALRSLEDVERPETILLLSPGESEPPERLRAQVDQVLVGSMLPPFLRRAEYEMARFQNPLVYSTMSRFPPTLDLVKHHVDCVFAGSDFGPTFRVPSINWIADFQHVHLPDMFAPAEVCARNASFRNRITYSDRIVLCSDHARRDLEQFAPQAIHKARMLPFVAQVPPNIYDTDPSWICDHYRLPEKFFYLPNQFWKHKNHPAVVAAVGQLQSQYPDITIVCTGNTSDYRHPTYFPEWLASLSTRGVRNQFILLGLVPREHLFHLMRQSVAVLQPSLFEGWSSTVEEIKSLGKRMILSDIPVHREQNPPQSIFFDPADANALAECLARVWIGTTPGPDRELEAQARANLPGRVLLFARTLMQVVHELVSDV